jgi:hypothetical protein
METRLKAKSRKSLHLDTLECGMMQLRCYVNLLGGFLSPSLNRLDLLRAIEFVS